MMDGRVRVCVCVCVCTALAAKHFGIVSHAGAIDTVIAVLRQHFDSPNVIKAACNALGNISGNGQYCIPGDHACGRLIF